MVRFDNGRAAGPPVLIRPDAGDYMSRGMSKDGAFFYSVAHEMDDVYQATVDPETLQVEKPPTRLIETFRGRNTWPLWSPAGDAFVYFSRRAEGDVSPSRMIVQYEDGKETDVKAAHGDTPNRGVQWCQGGDRIVGPGRKRIFDLRTGEVSSDFRDLRFPQAPYSHELALSPDCKTAYVLAWTQANKRRVYRMDLATGAETELLNETAEPAYIARPSVSPDGRWLVFRSQGQILLLPTEGGGLRELDRYTGGLPMMDMAWTPDSKRVIYTRLVKSANGRDPQTELYWVSIEGGTPHSMGIRMPGGIRAASLHPDGKRLLFSARSSNIEFWVLRNLPLD